MLSSLDCCHNCIYKDDESGNILVYDIYDITVRQSIHYFDFEDYKYHEILVEYN